MKKILLMMLHICNDSEEQLVFNLMWYGYCITGNTNLQKYLCNVGHSASNGKSTLIKMFSAAFSIYVEKLGLETFSVDYQKKHKQLKSLEAPVRLGYIEEPKDTKMDIEYLKDFVDGDRIKNEVMFGTVENLKIQAKLQFNTNKVPNFVSNCPGNARRALMQFFTNKFVDEEEFEKLGTKTGFYKKNTMLDKMMEMLDFKLAMCHIILPFAKLYYDNQMKIISPLWKVLEENFKEANDQNDPLKDFIEQRCIITGKSEDRIGKVDFLSQFQSYMKSKKSWIEILNDIKRLTMGFQYNPKLRKDGLQGCLTGIKWMNDFEDSHEEPIGHSDTQEKIQVDTNEKKNDIEVSADVKIMNILTKYICSNKEENNQINPQFTQEEKKNDQEFKYEEWKFIPIEREYVKYKVVLPLKYAPGALEALEQLENIEKIFDTKKNLNGPNDQELKNVEVKEMQQVQKTKTDTFTEELKKLEKINKECETKRKQLEDIDKQFFKLYNEKKKKRKISILNFD
jgi:hypothetical protein